MGLYLRDHTQAEKAARLECEGVEVADGVVEDFDELVFRGFKTRRPLARLIEIQHELAGRVCEQPLAAMPSIVAGFDVSYASDGSAVGACAVVETETGHLVWSATHRVSAPLPYIPSLLTFRELPALLALAKEARRQFAELNLFIVDGNGILHPRGAGVAACFGVVVDVPTIGVAKSQLCGQLEKICRGSKAAAHCRSTEKSSGPSSSGAGKHIGSIFPWVTESISPAACGW